MGTDNVSVLGACYRMSKSLPDEDALAVGVPATRERAEHQHGDARTRWQTRRSQPTVGPHCDLHLLLKPWMLYPLDARVASLHTS